MSTPKSKKRRTSASPKARGSLSPEKTKDKQRDHALDAMMLLSPLYQHTAVAAMYLPHALDREPLESIRDPLNEVKAVIDKVKAGDLSGIEAMLVGQAVSLNSLYLYLLKRSTGYTNQNSEGIAATETFLKLAFKAQAQSRANMEALIELKLPRPVAFVNQANFAGQQQINNGTLQAPAPARGADNNVMPPKLNDESANGTLERSCPQTAVPENPPLEAVAILNRAAQ